jgi:hypothetical protein
MLRGFEEEEPHNLKGEKLVFRSKDCAGEAFSFRFFLLPFWWENLNRSNLGCGRSSVGHEITGAKTDHAARFMCQLSVGICLFN